MTAGLLAEVVARLEERFGPSGWWPAATPFEVIAGAILVQNTAWTRVEPAIVALRAAGRLDPVRVAEISEEEVAALIRPAGTFRAKARYLLAISRRLAEVYGGDVARALAGPTAEKRAELLSLPGVGRETADSILNYAGEHAIFVVDSYTRRIFGRHRLLDPAADYDVVRAWFEARLPPGPTVRRELHAHLVEVGKSHCRPRAPRCSTCPLRFLFVRVPAPLPEDSV